MTPRTRSILLVSGAVLLAGCAAGDPRFTAEAPAGFWVGLWHGMISWIALFVHLFADSVRVYEPHNTGGWYDFGFLVGIGLVWKGGSHTATRRARAVRVDREWEEIGRKVEAKLKRKIQQWAEAEPDEAWDVVEAKAEAKLKRKLRAWAEDDGDDSGSHPTLPG